MLTKAVVFYGLMALLFVVGVHTDETQVVENCDERIDQCMKLASTDEEIVEKGKEAVTCFMSFLCKPEEDELRMNALMEFGGKIANSQMGPSIPEKFGNFGPHPGMTDNPFNMAVIISVSYKTLVASAVTMFLLA